MRVSRSRLQNPRNSARRSRSSVPEKGDSRIRASNRFTDPVAFRIVSIAHRDSRTPFPSMTLYLCAVRVARHARRQLCCHRRDVSRRGQRELKDTSGAPVARSCRPTYVAHRSEYRATLLARARTMPAGRGALRLRDCSPPLGNVREARGARLSTLSSAVAPDASDTKHLHVEYLLEIIRKRRCICICIAFYIYIYNLSLYTS